LESLAHGQGEIGPEDAGENCSESGSLGAAVVSMIGFGIRSNDAYAQKLRDLARRLGLPADYVDGIR
jgi:hypothetical protein